MPSKIIQKRSDPQVLYLRRVRDGKERGLVFCEGPKLVEELLASEWIPTALYCTPDRATEAVRLAKSRSTPLPVHLLSDSVMDFCSDLSTPPGLIALAKPPAAPKISASSLSTQLTLVLHGLQLPQNVGGLLRSSEAAGVAAVFLTGASADPWGPKALRGSAGSGFRVPVERRTSLADVLADLRAAHVRTVAATQHGRKPYDGINWSGGVALVMGSEGGGFSAEEMKLFDETIRIPMKGRVESLNVGTAAAVCLFEAARQRTHGH